MGTIKIEYGAGCSLESCFKDAIRLATLLNVTVDFDFNGVSCFGVPNGDIQKGIKEFESVFGKRYKLAYS